jgi:dipeptidyl aminopeptidase/acylaminoacyl peptidase
MQLSRFRSFLCAALLALPAAGVRAELPALIPRDILFGNPEKTSPRLSPDGKRLAWIAPDKKNVLQVWVKTIGKDDDKVVTADKKRGIRSYAWMHDGKGILYNQDLDGDENWHIYGVDLDSGNVRDYTPFQGVRGSIVADDPAFPDQVLVGLNLRDRKAIDVYRLTLSTGALVLDTQNPGDVAGWTADAKMQIRGAQIATPEGGTEVRVRDSVSAPWRSWVKLPAQENFNLLDFTADGGSAIVQTSQARDTAAVLVRPLAGGADKVLAASDEVDALRVTENPKKHVIEAVAFAPDRSRWTIVDPSVKGDYDALAKLNDGDFQVVSRDDADRTWLVAFDSDRGPTRYYAWDRAAKKGTFLFVTRPKLEGVQLAAMKPVVITSRDGLKLHSYLTVPVGVPEKNLPMVLFVHGGPWARDTWGYDPWAQWLSNRGYAVLQVNFRSSDGFGKKFLHAGDREWGLKMQDDLTDAVEWAIEQGIADPKKVAIMGGSYGGYATLAGVTKTPDLYACGVDIVGPSNLKTLIGSIPPYWKPIRSMFDQRMGNVDDPKDAELVKNASPLFFADRIKKPLLIGQGANDPRVNVKESEQIVSAIEKNHGKVTYVVYSDEGHGFARPENRIDFNARAEKFLAGCLGGRAEPMEGEKMAGSTAAVRVIE